MPPVWWPNCTKIPLAAPLPSLCCAPHSICCEVRSAANGIRSGANIYRGRGEQKGAGVRSFLFFSGHRTPLSPPPPPYSPDMRATPALRPCLKPPQGARMRGEVWARCPPGGTNQGAGGAHLMASGGTLHEGSPWRLSILRNANVAYLCRLFMPMSHVKFKK